MIAKSDGALRLMAQDAADLGVISAAVQDAVARPVEFAYEPAARRFTAPLIRFRWERVHGDATGPDERVHSALQVHDVLSARARGFSLNDPDAVLSLLALHFEADAEGPGGELRFVFAGDADAALRVECVEVMLSDVSEPWAARRRPAHR